RLPAAVGQDHFCVQPAAGTRETRVRLRLGDVEGTVAQELDAVDIRERIAAQALLDVAFRGIQERTVERVARQCKKGHEPQARSQQLPRLQRARSSPVPHPGRASGYSPL